MKGALLFLSIISAANAAERTFTDDKGTTHTTELDSPTIVTWAHRAVTLGHYGLNNTQLLGTWGEWTIVGSDYDFDKPELGSSFPADPTPEEMRMLTQVVNLSPSCSTKYCTEFNLATLKELNPDFLLIHGYRHKAWAMSDDLQKNITEIMGNNTIYTEISLDGDDCASDGNYKNCYGKSMIDVINQNLEISNFLNFEVPSRFNDDMVRLCNSAKKFQAHMVKAHEKGLRVMAAYLSTKTSYFATPIHDMVLRMLEELGMPLLHVGACTNSSVCSFEYFWEWLPMDEYFTDCAEGEVSIDCNNKTLYPVDFWLYDHRTTISVTNENFARRFPDRAIIAKQYDYWPIGGSLITPYHAANILDHLGPSLAAANRLNPKTECTSAKVSERSHRMDGLEGGQYACYDESEHNDLYFSECPSAAIKVRSAATTLIPTIGITLLYLFSTFVPW